MKTPAIQSQEIKKICFDLEVCRARIEIRDYFLGTTIKDVYEQVGQVLSSVNYKLAAEELNSKKASQNVLEESRELVRQSINDLRQMTRRLHPDEEILKEGGLIWALQYTCTFLGGPIIIQTDKSLKENLINDGIKLITFKLLLHVLLSIKKENKSIKELRINNINEQVVYSISIINKDNKKDNLNSIHYAAISPLLSMINATCSIDNNLKNKIIISIPKKIKFYE